MFNLTKRLFTSKVLLNNCIIGSSTLNSTVRNCYYLLHPPLKVKLKNVAVDKYVMNLEDEYIKLTTQSDVNRPSERSRLQELQPIIDILKTRSEIIKNLDNLKDLLEDADKEMKELAAEEKTAFEDKIEVLEHQLLNAILPIEKLDDRDSFMLEVNAGVGGQESMLFARELFYMYCSFAQYKKWNSEVIDYLTNETGGVRHAVALINGKQAFRYFKYEAGVHRVQRIPATEKGGRVHTSTVSVLVLPEPTEIEIIIDNKDLRIETKKATGAGGQHVNTTDSAVRITHIPTGISVECQTDRSQIRNKKVAMQKLRSIMYDKQLQEENAKMESAKKSQVKSNFRNEKIRTYNFSQDRITDHRLQNGNAHNLKVFLSGGESLETLMNRLHENTRIEKLLNYVNDLHK